MTHGNEPVKAITVRQPWASLIMAGIKPVENRTWRTGYRGTLAIHAGLAVDAAALARHGHLLTAEGALPAGVILGTVTLAGCVQDSASEWAEPGCWHWLLAVPRPLEVPAPAQGRLGLWTPPAAVAYPA